MREERPPHWLTILFCIGLGCTFLGLVGSIIVEAKYGAISPGKHYSIDAMLGPGVRATYIRFVTFALTSFGLTFELALVYTGWAGSFYSGIAKRQVTAQDDPRHFWCLLTSISLLPLGMMAYGVYEFLMVK